MITGRYEMHPYVHFTASVNQAIVDSGFRPRAPVRNKSATNQTKVVNMGKVVGKQWSLSHIRPLCTALATSAGSPPSAFNTRLPAVAVYITLADGQCAMAKFPKSRVWHKVPEGSTLILEIP